MMLNLYIERLVLNLTDMWRVETSASERDALLCGLLCADDVTVRDRFDNCLYDLRYCSSRSRVTQNILIFSGIIYDARKVRECAVRTKQQLFDTLLARWGQTDPSLR